MLAPMMGHSCMRAELQEGHTHTQGHSEELGAFLREVRSPYKVLSQVVARPCLHFSRYMKAMLELKRRVWRSQPFHESPRDDRAVYCRSRAGGENWILQGFQRRSS